MTDKKEPRVSETVDLAEDIAELDRISNLTFDDVRKDKEFVKSLTKDDMVKIFQEIFDDINRRAKMEKKQAKTKAPHKG